MKRFAIVLLTLGVLALASTPALAAHGCRTSYYGGSHYGGYGGHYGGYRSYGGHHYRPHVSYRYSPRHSSFGYHGRGFSFSFGH